MSDYFRELDSLARKRYIDKLMLLGLTEKDDPYLLKDSTRFVDDLTKWPPVEYGNIFCYFIERPGVYTRRQLLQWKSLDAYNYFQSGHVRTVKIWPLAAADCSLFIGLVNPSQSSPEKAHQAWVGVRQDGEIITAHCTCMAG